MQWASLQATKDDVTAKLKAKREAVEKTKAELEAMIVGMVK